MFDPAFASLFHYYYYYYDGTINLNGKPVLSELYGWRGVLVDNRTPLITCWFFCASRQNVMSPPFGSARRRSLNK